MSKPRQRITATEREPDPGQQWKLGDEFLPFHPQASHVPPDYRDGWNRCWWMAVTRQLPAHTTQDSHNGCG
jgi:hypothetical protein